MSLTLTPLSNPWIRSLKGLLFPPVCLTCNRFMGLSAQEVICACCRPQLPLCEQGTDRPEDGGLDGSFFLYRYGHMARRLVHRIKMTGDVRATTWLSAELKRLPPMERLPLIPDRLATSDALTGSAVPNQPAFDLVVPVPSHRRQPLLRSEEGPSLLWAEALGNFFHAPVRRALRRVRTVPKQTSLGRAKRLAVPESSLAVTARLLPQNSSVLLADDVMTTGATARTCARVLKQAGAGRVTLAAIARG